MTSGTLDIAKNGAFDVTAYKNVKIAVPASETDTLGTKNISSNGEIDVTGYSKVDVNVPISNMISVINKGIVADGGSTRSVLSLPVTYGCYYILAVSGAETGTDYRVTNFSGCEIITTSSARGGFRGCHGCLYIVRATSSAITFPSWPNDDMDGRVAIAMKIS